MLHMDHLSIWGIVRLAGLGSLILFILLLMFGATGQKRKRGKKYRAS